MVSVGSLVDVVVMKANPVAFAVHHLPNVVPATRQVSLLASIPSVHQERSLALVTLL